MSDFKYEIKNSVGVIGETVNGWKKELNIVSWNERTPKIDIRDWDEAHVKMGKGITLDKDEFIKLKELFADVDVSALG